MGAPVADVVSALVGEWRLLDVSTLQFWRRDVAQLSVISLAAIAAVALLVRLAIKRSPGRHHLVVPAILRGLTSSRLAWVQNPLESASSGLMKPF